MFALAYDEMCVDYSIRAKKIKSPQPRGLGLLRKTIVSLEANCHTHKEHDAENEQHAEKVTSHPE